MPTHPSHPRRKPVPRDRQQRERSRFFFFRVRVMLVLVAVFGVFVSIHMAKLNTQVRSQFEGKRWALPARVYANALELHPGKNVDAASFMRELQALGYRQVKDIEGPGEFQRRQDTFLVKTRSFDFWDGSEHSRDLRFQFNKDGKVSQITDMEKKQNLILHRLEPRLIGKIYPTHNEDRILVSLEQVPELLIKAVMAMEDRQFYEHHGISVRGIVRALVHNIFRGDGLQGGSTITQQLVKNLILSPERTLSRKINEAMMALIIEWHYDKNQILEAYLNEVYLGQNGPYAIHGMGSAAWFYFGRSVEDLKVPEIAMLVGLVRAASNYNPRRNPVAALNRRELVLNIMYQQGLIDKEIHEQALKSSLDISEETPASQNPYPAFLELVREQLKRDYREEDLRSEGLQIFTTLEPFMQYKAENAMLKQIRHLEKNSKARKLESALIVTSTETGEIMAMVGGRQTRYDGFNRALKAVRPIGSLVKPAVYLAALEDNQRFSLLSRLDDKPFTWKDKHSNRVWQPKNYDGKTRGSVPLIQALVFSYNLPTVHLGFEIGLPKVKEAIKRLGVERDFPAYPSMLLGGISLTPLEVTQMYQTLANSGFRMPVRAIREITAHNGEQLKRYGLSVDQHFDSAPVFVLNYAMQEVVRRGTGRRTAQDILPKDIVLAGKTGTSNDARDSWFAGFGQNLLAVAWLGRDDNRPIHLDGGNGGMRVWAEAMNALNVESLDSASPTRVKWRWVDANSWQYSERSGAGVRMPFVTGTDSLLTHSSNISSQIEIPASLDLAVMR
jgi:penicillin-binding protein 1B